MRPLKFSKKQRRVLTWWRPSSPDSGYDAILCEGAVRSGKTLCTGLSFFCWAMTCFAQKSFALCGKSVPAVRRNLWQELRPIMREMGFQIRERLSQNRIDVTLGKRRNTFYLFGGLDERSAALVQGITLAGALLDEAALMPRSFVEQVCARCSVEGSRLWFSCNPESPAHWFYQEWIQKAEETKELITLRTEQLEQENKNIARSRERQEQLESRFQNSEICIRFRRKEEWKPSAKDWAELCQNLDLAYNNFTIRIKKLNDLTDKELKIACLIKANVSPGIISHLLCCSTASVSMTRKRLYQKIHNESGSAEQFDDFIRQF